ncbi:helix-turn-helix domain-containing protein [Robertkochia aurantiaca]|uniref:helix-turn-helix domain-containing protein n=1 Tax=Robertkochia aurantiaca TaxID=2873700 RepID=UPI001CCFFA47|nr:helix-turn-helix domain-containing protein [Robertkochia sp. 3YJGBD-33]
MKIDKEKLAETIKDRREKIGYTQTELSNETGISLRSIQRIEKGEVLPRPFTIRALQETLNFSDNDLRKKTQQPEVKPANQAKKIILSAASVPIFLLLAFAFLIQSSGFPETAFEGSLFWAAVVFFIALLQWFIWRK